MGSVGLAWWIAVGTFVALLTHGTFVAVEIGHRAAIVWAIAGGLVFLDLASAGASDWQTPAFAVLELRSCS